MIMYRNINLIYRIIQNAYFTQSFQDVIICLNETTNYTIQEPDDQSHANILIQRRLVVCCVRAPHLYAKSE